MGPESTESLARVATDTERVADGEGGCAASTCEWRPGRLVCRVWEPLARGLLLEGGPSATIEERSHTSNELAEARPLREWRVGATLASPTTDLRAAAPGQEATELESALERESRRAASEHGAVAPQC